MASFALTMRIADDPEQIRAAVTGLALVSLAQMEAMPFPPLYTSGIRYQREPEGRENWQTASESLARGFGDCEDLAAYRAAELWAAGEPAAIDIKRVNAELIHIRVRRSDGTIEDPSKLLGM